MLQYFIIYVYDAYKNKFLSTFLDLWKSLMSQGHKFGVRTTMDTETIVRLCMPKVGKGTLAGILKTRMVLMTRGLPLLISSISNSFRALNLKLFLNC
jgi:hypothetical protein